MPTTRVALLWHMHQPVYRDPESGEYILPWVRLHATRAYYDMARVLAEFPRARATINWVPSLLAQLEDYIHGRAHDRFLDLTRKPADALEPHERAFVLRNFFMVDWETCVKPLPRYWELLQQRGPDLNRIDLDRAAAETSAGALRDLQVLFNLAWFGFKSFEEEEGLRALREKGRDFTEADKQEVLRIQHKILGQVMPALAELARRGQAELTVTPFYHPILPLLCDSDAARRAMPNATLPQRFQFPEDAHEQVRRALEFAESRLGVRPKGMWPAEGSVSPEALEVFAKEGVQYVCSDEEVLLRSLQSPSRGRDLPRTYEVEAGGGRTVKMLFRDRGLSDLIGFTYARSPAQDAVNDFLGHLARIGAGSEETPTVGVFLDGENPWEHYPDSGRDFLRLLYGALERSEQGIEAVTLGEAFEKSPPTRKIARIHSGSWIEANYRIWISHPEDNLGWDLLGQARRLLARKQAEGYDPQKCQAARDALLVAEGSDWFWWYGDDFTTESAAEFDALFRGYVLRAFEQLGEPAPDRLREPIARRARAQLPAAQQREPDVLIHPPLDGQATAYYGWAGAVAYRPAGDRGAMHQGQGAFAELFYGFDLGHLYLRLDPRGTLEALHGMVDELELELASGGRERHVRVRLDDGPLHPQLDEKPVGSGKLDAVATLAVELAAVGLSPGDRVALAVRALRGGVEVERLPRSGALRFTVPDPDFERVHWRV